MNKPTYTYERQYTRNGNRMQRFQIIENGSIFLHDPKSEHPEDTTKRIAIVFDENDARQLVDLLNSLPNGTVHWNDVLGWYQKNKPHELKEEYRLGA